MKKVLFRADAHDKIGTGDLASLIQLSFYFRDLGWEPSFLTKATHSAKKLLKSFDVCNIHFIDPSSSVESEVIEINSLIQTHCLDAIFFELTDIKYSNYISVDSNCFKACVCFDGLVDASFQFILDWGINAKQNYKHLNLKQSCLLLGPEYTILPYQFDFELISSRMPTAHETKKVLVMMGGGDEFNLSCKVLSALTQIDQLEITIVIGAGYAFEEDLAKIISKSQYRINVQSCISNMFDYYMNTDIFIGAGGLASTEAIACRLNTILISTYEHQIERCKFYNSKNWATYLGHLDFQPVDLINAMNSPNLQNTNLNFNTTIIVDLFTQQFERRKNE